LYQRSHYDIHDAEIRGEIDTRFRAGRALPIATPLGGEGTTSQPQRVGLAR
jgi:hypothetical protein